MPSMVQTLLETPGMELKIHAVLFKALSQVCIVHYIVHVCD